MMDRHFWILFFAVVATGLRAFSCEPCFKVLTLSESVDQADLVVVGHQDENLITRQEKPDSIRVVVEQVLKGTSAEKTILINSWDGMCPYGIVVDDASYVMILSRQSNGYNTVNSGCSVKTLPFSAGRVRVDDHDISLSEFRRTYLLKKTSQEQAPVRVDILLTSTSSWDGGLLPVYPKGQPEVTVAKIIIPPGQALPFHQHPVINAGCLLKGTLTVETDTKQTIRLKAGDPLIEVVNRWHRGKNEGTEPVEILVVYAGVVGTPITVRK